MKVKEQWEDPIVAEVRRVRDRLAKQFQYDVKAICADLMKRQGPTVRLEDLGAGKYPAAKIRPALVRETPSRQCKSR